MWCFRKFLLQDVTRENKLRLLMIYAAVHPEKFEGDKIAKLMEVTPFPLLMKIYYFFPVSCIIYTES